MLTQNAMGTAIGTSSAVRESLSSIVEESHGEMRLVPTCETALDTTISVEIENTGLTGFHSFSEWDLIVFHDTATIESATRLTYTENPDPSAGQ